MNNTIQFSKYYSHLTNLPGIKHFILFPSLIRLKENVDFIVISISSLQSMAELDEILGMQGKIYGVPYLHT